MMLLACNPPVAAQRARVTPDTLIPIERGEPGLDACGANGRVTGLKVRGDSFLSVRAGPSIRSREIDRLRNGDLLWVCAQAPSGWHGVVYASPRTLDRDCGVTTPATAGGLYRGPCSSGWVAAKYVEIIAG